MKLSSTFTLIKFSCLIILNYSHQQCLRWALKEWGPRDPFLSKSGVLMMGFNTFSTCGTLMRSSSRDATLLKKMGPFVIGCVKRHENAVQREHWSILHISFTLSYTCTCCISTLFQFLLLAAKIVPIYHKVLTPPSYLVNYSRITNVWAKII